MSFFSSVGSFLGSETGGNLLRTGASLASTAGNIFAANQAAEATGDAAQQSTALQHDIYQQNRADLAPYRAAGYGALNEQANLLGLGAVPEWMSRNIADAERVLAFQQQQPGTQVPDYWSSSRAASGDPSIEAQQGRLERLRDMAAEKRSSGVTNALRSLPGYQFRMDEGRKAVDRSAAARGMSLSGKTLKDLTRFGQGVADQTYGQQVNRMAGLAGTGQTATNTMAQLGTNFGQQAGRNALMAGDARASSYLTGAQQAGRGLNNLAYIWGS